MTAPSSRFDLAGRVIIVTGGGSGIGKVYSERLAQAGARVVVADLKREDASRIASELNAAGAEAIAVQGDISEKEATARMAEAAVSAYGRIDGLVNNAGLMSVLPRRPWHQIPVEE